MNMKKALAGLALTEALSSVAGTAVAATQYPVQGGQWNYGFNGVGIYSDYLHGSQCHGSSVWNDWGGTTEALISSPGAGRIPGSGQRPGRTTSTTTGFAKPATTQIQLSSVRGLRSKPTDGLNTALGGPKC